MTVGFTIELLDPKYDRTKFACGEEALDNYLRKQARQDVRRRVAACYLAVESDKQGCWILYACSGWDSVSRNARISGKAYPLHGWADWQSIWNFEYITSLYLTLFPRSCSHFRIKGHSILLGGRLVRFCPPRIGSFRQSPKIINQAYLIFVDVSPPPKHQVLIF